MKQKFDVTGMTCSACVAHVEKAVKKLPGVQDVAVSLMTNSMQVEYDDSALNSGAHFRRGFRRRIRRTADAAAFSCRRGARNAAGPESG